MFENPFNEGGHHPDIDADPEAMVPASESAKSTLVDTIYGKVGELLPKAFSKARRLQRSNHPAEIITATRYNPTSKRNPNQLAKISITIDSPTDADPMCTDYLLSDSPDGLQISKRIRQQTPSRFLKTSRGRLFSLEGNYDIENLKAERRAKQESEQLENELGLSFVSEIESREVIVMVEEAQPVTP